MLMRLHEAWEVRKELEKLDILEKVSNVDFKEYIKLKLIDGILFIRTPVPMGLPDLHELKVEMPDMVSLKTILDVRKYELGTEEKVKDIPWSGKEIYDFFNNEKYMYIMVDGLYYLESANYFESTFNEFAWSKAENKFIDLNSDYTSSPTVLTMTELHPMSALAIRKLLETDPGEYFTVKPCINGGETVVFKTFELNEYIDIVSIKFNDKVIRTAMLLIIKTFGENFKLGTYKVQIGDESFSLHVHAGFIEVYEPQHAISYLNVREARPFLKAFCMEETGTLPEEIYMDYSAQRYRLFTDSLCTLVSEYIKGED